MRTYTKLNAAAILALATLFTACGPEIVTVTTEKVVEKTVLVCLDEAHTRVEASQLCPDGERPVTQYVCQSNGQTVTDPNTCPEITVECPVGTVPWTDGHEADVGCLYVNTCHEGWAYVPSSGTCKKYCAVGETLSADGVCKAVSTEDEPFVYIGHKEPNMFRVTHTAPGVAHVAFDLLILTNQEVRLRGVAFMPRFLTTTGWATDRDFAVVLFDSCAIVGSPTGAAWHRPDILSDGSEAEFSLSYPDVIHRGRTELTVQCQMKPNVAAPFTYGLYLYAAGIDDAATGNTYDRPTVVFGDSNADATQQVTVEAPPACPVPTISLAPGSPRDAAVPSWGSVLLFNVGNAAVCNPIRLTSVTVGVVASDNADSGWFDCARINPLGSRAGNQLYETRDFSSPVFTQINCHQETATALNVMFSGQSLNKIDSAQTDTFSFLLDTSEASAARDDDLRADVREVCYRDLVTGEDRCLSGPVVTGKTLFY